MTIFIDNQSGAPIYDQIFTQLKTQILTGALGEGEALPSIRGLAKDLRISVITTKRAYDELESDGLIHTLPGKGSFVAKTDRLLLRQEHLRQIREHLERISALASVCDISDGEIWKMYETVKEERL